MKLKRTLITLAAAGALSLAMGTAQAGEVAVTLVAKCAPTGPAVVGCVAAGAVLHELVQLGNGKEAFGPNGEGMKLLHGVGSLFGGGTDRKDPIVSSRTQSMRN